MVSRLRRWAW